MTEDAYICRSFDYKIISNECFLYEENIVDEIFVDLKRNQSSEYNHYSSKELFEYNYCAFIKIDFLI